MCRNGKGGQELGAGARGHPCWSTWVCMGKEPFTGRKTKIAGVLGIRWQKHGRSWVTLVNGGMSRRKSHAWVRGLLHELEGKQAIRPAC